MCSPFGDCEALLGHATTAPQRSETVLRGFWWASPRQSNSLSTVLLGRPWASGAASDDLEAAFTIDMGNSIHETCGPPKKEGPPGCWPRCGGGYRIVT